MRGVNAKLGGELTQNEVLGYQEYWPISNLLDNTQ